MSSYNRLSHHDPSGHVNNFAIFMMRMHTRHGHLSTFPAEPKFCV